MNRFLAPALFLVCFAVNLHYAAPSIFADDSPETVAACFNAGVTHPPGDPGLLVAGKLWSYLPLGGPGFRINLLSCLLAALLAPVLWRLAASGHAATILAAGATGIMLCCHPMLRQQAAVAKGAVYLGNLLILAAAARAHALGKPVLVAACAGLLFSHHWMTLACFAPLFLFVLFPRSLRGSAARRFAMSLFAFSLTGSLWLALPIRAAQNPPLNSGKPATAVRFANHFIRKPFLEREMRPAALTWARQAWLGLGALKRGMSWLGLGLALAGAVFLYPARKGAMALALAAAACPLLAASAYLDLRPEIAHLMDVFLLPSFLGLAYLAINAILALSTSGFRRMAAALMLAAIPFFQAGPLALKNVSRFTWSYDIGRAFLAPLPPGAGLIVISDLDTFPLWYHQQVELYRRDVLVVNRTLLKYDWYRETILGDAEIAPDYFSGRVEAAMTRLFRDSKRQWFTCPTPMHGIPGHWLVIPYFLSFRISPWYSPPVPFGRFSARGSRERALLFPDPYSIIILGYMDEAARNLEALRAFR